MSNSSNIELVSIKYKGHKSYDRSSKILICSNYHKDRDEAEQELKIMANYLGRDMVVDVEILKDKEKKETERGGTYIYTVWKYKGYAVNKI